MKKNILVIIIMFLFLLFWIWPLGVVLTMEYFGVPKDYLVFLFCFLYIADFALFKEITK